MVPVEAENGHPSSPAAKAGRINHNMWFLLSLFSVCATRTGGMRNKSAPEKNTTTADRIHTVACAALRHATVIY
jgi:hypothetical protein